MTPNEKYFVNLVQELIKASRKDKELRDGLEWIIKTRVLTGKSRNLYEAILEIIMDSEQESRIKNWMQNTVVRKPANGETI